MGLLNFFKRKSSEIPKEQKKQKERYLEMVDSYEKLTLRTISTALHLASEYHLDKSVKRHRANFLSNDTFYTMEIDKDFQLTLRTENHPNRVLSCKAELKDDKHELVPYELKEELTLFEPDKDIQWQQTGPWIKMIENKIKSIYTAYQFKMKQEEEELKRNINHFKEIFPYAPEIEGELIFRDMEKMLSKAVEAGLVTCTEQTTTVLGPLGNPLTIYLYTFGYFEISITHSRANFLTIRLKDKDYKLTICDCYQSDDKPIHFEETYWRNVFINEFLKLDDQIVDKKQEKIQASTDHFTKKYKIKSIL